MSLDDAAPVKNMNEFISFAERLAIVDWMQHMSAKRKMPRETLYLSIHLFDKVMGRLSKDQKSFQHIEAISLVSFWMASKLQEENHISIKTMPLCVTTSSFSDLISYESLILKTVDWKIHASTMHTWLGIFEPQFVTFLCRPQFQKESVKAEDFDSFCPQFLDMVVLIA
jgi:hypothetical protein